MNETLFSKKSFSYFSGTYKNKFDFFCHQKIIFFKFLKTYLIFFLKPKDFVLFNKQRSEFSLQKPLFFTQQKQILFYFIFYKLKSNSFTHNNRFDFLNKEDDAFINKFV